MRWEQSLPPDLWLRKYRLKVRSHLAQITNEAAVGPGLELQVRSWTPSTCLMLPPTQDHHVAKEMQQLDGLSVFVLGPSVPVVRCLELARLKTFLGPRHLPQIIGTGSINVKVPWGLFWQLPQQTVYGTSRCLRHRPGQSELELT